MPEPPDPSRAGSTRRDPWVLGVVALALLVARIVTGVRDWQHPTAAVDRMHWVPAEAAAAVSSASGKPILYEFSAAWCGPCKTLQAELFDDEQRAQSIERIVVPVKVVDRVREDGHNSASVDSLQHACNVTGFPTLVLVRDGRILDRIVGYQGALPTLQWLVAARQRASFAH